MSFDVVAERLDTADLSASPPTFFSRFTLDKTAELKAIRTWIVKYGTPGLTTLGLELRTGYNSVTGARELIATSSKTWTLADISSSNYACKEIWFDWDNAPLLKAGIEYTLNLVAAGYTGSDTDHLAWVRTYPDTVGPFSGSTNYNTLNRFPFQIAMITREARR